MTARVEESALDPAIGARLKRTPDGLVCAVTQQRGTGEVLMVAWMDDEALHRTLTTGRATYWSRSREEYWVKGETSGQRAARPRGAAGLRRRRPARRGRPDRPGVPHGHPHLLRHGRPTLRGVTEELFATDAYRRSFDATIAEVDRDGGRVALARTAFYPGGGGQPHDLGTLDWGAGAAPVTRVKREAGRIWHWVDAPELPGRAPRSRASSTGAAATC